MRIQEEFLMFQKEQKYLMSDLWHIYICIKVKKVERGGNRAYAVWTELDLGVPVEGNEKR